MKTGRQAKLVFSYIGANVRQARINKGMTQAQLAEVVDVDLRYIQRIERGTTNFTITVLIDLAVALGVDSDKLLRPAVLPPPKRGRPPKA